MVDRRIHQFAWRSFLHNDEVNAVVLRQEFGAQMRAMFEADLPASQPVTLEAWEGQAIYPEGGLTKDGALRPARLGLLDYMTRSFDPAAGRDIVFIPVGINYDRTFEDRSQVLACSGDTPRPGIAAVASTTVRFLLRNLVLMLRGQWYRFGYACVNFGSPRSMRAFCRERGIDPRALSRDDRFREVEALATELMEAVG